jgi:hypothetical protein
MVAVIGSAVVPTLIAQRWFQPERPASEHADVSALSLGGETVTPVPIRSR